MRRRNPGGWRRKKPYLYYRTYVLFVKGETGRGKFETKWKWYEAGALSYNVSIGESAAFRVLRITKYRTL